MLEYRAEGLCRNANHLSREELSRCMASGEVLQSTALAYDTGHRLRFELGGLRGIMPFADCVDAAPGETVKKIILELVGKGSVEVSVGSGSGMSANDVLEMITDNVKPVLMGILKQEIFEEGQLSYEY